MGCVGIDAGSVGYVWCPLPAVVTVRWGTRILGVQGPFAVVGSIDRFDRHHNPEWVEIKEKQDHHSTELEAKIWIRGLN